MIIILHLLYIYLTFINYLSIINYYVDGENAMINSLDIKSSVVAIDRQSKDNNGFSSDGIQQRHLDHDYKIKKNNINPDNYEQSQIHEGNASASTILTQYIQNEPKKPINNNLIGVQSR